MLTKKSKARLKKLIDLMSSLPKSAANHFDMMTWYSHDGDHQHKAPKDGKITRALLNECGTVACAAGWAATIPSFKKAGFTCDLRGNLSKEPAEFFDIPMDMECDLFYGDAMTPKEWAREAKKLVRTWDKKEPLYRCGDVG